MRAALLSLVLVACSGPQPSLLASASSAPASSSAPAPVASASTSAAPRPSPTIDADEAEQLLFLGRAPEGASACRELGDAPASITCLLRLAYAADDKALTAVLALYTDAGIVTGLEPRQTMDGGWRGQLELVPELPVGRHRRHVEWLVPAYKDYRGFFDELQKRASAPLAYRYRPIRLRFFRSVGRTTPSAYASGWSVAYNVSGSLHTTPDAVRETMFHETFHLNDDGWSAKVLTPLYKRVLAGCTKGGALSTPCLRPYAPNETMVSGGTYYAFQPGNGVWEYAAELAIRYYDEHREVFAGRKLKARPFKCGPEPNAEAWRLLSERFFGAVDAVPPCG